MVVARSGDCPSPPVTIDEIAHLTPVRASACFGGEPLTFVALSAGPDAGILVLAFVPPALGRCGVSTDTSACPLRFNWVAGGP